MADILRLDGSAVDPAPLKRNHGIAETLTNLQAINDAGSIKAIIGLYICPDGMWQAIWDLPSADERNGFPWDLAAQGALMTLLGQMNEAAVERPPGQEDKP
jgi:hypothetical protein